MLPVLAGLELSGACQGELKGFDSEKDVNIHVSGSSKLNGSLGTGKAILGVERCELHFLDWLGANRHSFRQADPATSRCPSFW